MTQNDIKRTLVVMPYLDFVQFLRTFYHLNTCQTTFKGILLSICHVLENKNNYVINNLAS